MSKLDQQLKISESVKNAASYSHEKLKDVNGAYSINEKIQSIEPLNATITLMSTAISATTEAIGKIYTETVNLVNEPKNDAENDTEILMEKIEK